MKAAAGLLALVILASPAVSQAQLSVDFSKSYNYETRPDLTDPNGLNDVICSTNVKVIGLVNYSACFRFDPFTYDMRIVTASPSTTDTETEGFAGTWLCGLYTRSDAILAAEMRPWDKDMVVGGSIYRFASRQVATDGTVTLRYLTGNGGPSYVMAITTLAGVPTAVIGILPVGQTSLDPNNALRCVKS